MIAKQVQANGQAVASLTLCHMEKEAVSDHSDDAWAFAIVTTTESALIQTDTANNQVPSCIQQVLDQHSHVFQDPQTLPPSRSYDHAIPLIPGAVPMNARPYHYSPQLKT